MAIGKSFGGGYPVTAAVSNDRVKSSLSTGFAVRLLPPLIINEQEVNFFLKAMDKTLKMLSVRNKRYVP